jgi:hypothetical protein
VSRTAIEPSTSPPPDDNQQGVVGLAKTCEPRRDMFISILETMWWIWWAIEQRNKELEARVETLERQLREIALCFKAMLTEAKPE